MTKKDISIKYPRIIPSWPAERDLSQYSELTGIDFTKNLSNGQTWIDIGCRTGKAMSQTRKLYDANLIGINAHRIRVRKGIQSLLAAIPEDLNIYRSFRKKADLVTDIHGAISFCENPLHALIYESCLLKNQGRAILITREERLGNLVTWQRIEKFYDEIMKQVIKFKSFVTYKEDIKTPIKTLRVTIKGHCKSILKLNDLYAEAEHNIGCMEKSKVIVEPPDKSFQIWGVKYKTSF